MDGRGLLLCPIYPKIWDILAGCPPCRKRSNVQSSHRTTLLNLVLCVALSAATVAGVSGQTPALREAAPPGESKLSADVLYRILVGDIALQRGDAALAARAYFEAARDAQEPRLARRATEVAKCRRLAAARARQTPREHIVRLKIVS